MRELNTFFARGGKHLLIAISLVLISLYIVYSIVTSFIALTLPPIRLSNADLANFHPDSFHLYIIEPDASFPIGVRYWTEMKSWMITTGRTDDSYYGVYQLGDYYIFHSSDNYESLWEANASILGYITAMNQSDFQEIRALASDLPDSVLPLKISPAYHINFGKLIPIYIVAQLCLTGLIRHYYNLFARKNAGFPIWTHSLINWTWLGHKIRPLVMWILLYIRRLATWIKTRNWAWITKPLNILLGKAKELAMRFFRYLIHLSQRPAEGQVKSSGKYKITIMDETADKPKSKK